MTLSSGHLESLPRSEIGLHGIPKIKKRATWRAGATVAFANANYMYCNN